MHPVASFGCFYGCFVIGSVVVAALVDVALFLVVHMNSDISSLWDRETPGRQSTSKALHGNTKPSHDQHVTSMDTFRQRREHFAAACDRLGHEVVDDELTFPLVFENLAVCLPPKTGSTPFKMIVYYLLQNHTKPFFDVWYRDVHFDIPTAMYQHRSSLKSKTVKAVFVREPYSRLFSAYVDKLFKPRLDNWRIYGKLIVNYVRGPYEAPLSMICASDVTFPEFVRYIIMSEMGNIPMMKRNPHFYPLSRQCGLCNEPENDSLTYDFIGKTESFAADARGILRASGLPGRLPPDFDLDVAVPKWSMQMLINFTFTKHYFHPMSDTCMTREETLRRVWRFYHIRGLISTSELFPLSSSGAELVTCEEFLNMSLAAFERSRGDPKLGANKKAAMKEAYSAVPLKQRQALRKIFRRDFMLFQYPVSIPEVFPKGDRFVLEKFKYFDVFDRKNKNSF